MKREELEKAYKKIPKVRAGLVAVRMDLVLDTVGTAPARRDAEGCESPRIPLDNKAFSGFAIPERLSCTVPAATRHRFGTPVRQQAGRFCGMDGAVPEKEFLAQRGRKSLAPLWVSTREGIMRVRSTGHCYPLTLT